MSCGWSCLSSRCSIRCISGPSVSVCQKLIFVKVVIKSAMAIDLVLRMIEPALASSVVTAAFAIAAPS